MKILAVLLFWGLTFSVYANNLYVFLIDGNGSQLFLDMRDQNGNKSIRYGNDNAFSKAIRFGLLCNNCEVFVIHMNPDQLSGHNIDDDRNEKKERRKKTGFYFHHYKDGEPQEEFSVRADNMNYNAFEGMEQIASHINQKIQSTNASKSYDFKSFLFFGHRPVLRQSETKHSMELSGHSIAALGVMLAREIGRFDASILSNCKAGTPRFISLFAGWSDYSVGAPGDIDLSHFSINSLNVFQSESLTKLEKLESFTRDNFERQIEKRPYADVSMALYDHQKNLQFYRDIRESSLLTYTGDAEYLDCREFPEVFPDFNYPAPELVLFRENPNVNIHLSPYRNADGTLKLRTTHSGWICRFDESLLP